MPTSVSKRLIKLDLHRALIGLGLALAGALATWLEQDLMKIVDFGSYALIAAAVNSFAINLIRKYVKFTEY